MKRITLSLVALLLCLCIHAQHRSEQEAIQIAHEFFAKKQMNKAPRLSVVPQQKVIQQIQRRVASAKKAPNKNSSCYIINDEENNRFVIVAADERLNTILGYSDNNIFYVDETCSGLLDLLDEYNRQYEYLLENKERIKITTPKKAQKKIIPPMLSTTWCNSLFPYNVKCPVVNNDTCNAGIVAVNIAQVMNYHKYPIQGTGNIFYSIENPSIQISHNFGEDYFDWDNMLDDYRLVEANQFQIDAVSNLIYSCGVSVSSIYNYSTSTTANPNNIPYALIHFFKYNPNLVAYERNYFNDNEWYKIINQELEEGRPILYGGRTAPPEDKGYRLIIDGRDENGLYHINWGMVVKQSVHKR